MYAAKGPAMRTVRSSMLTTVGSAPPQRASAWAYSRQRSAVGWLLWAGPYLRSACPSHEVWPAGSKEAGWG